MPGSNNGTGYPLSFRCAKCRVFIGQDDDRRRYYQHRGRIRNVRLTGRTRIPSKPLHSARVGYRQSEMAYEYYCRDCHHVGWSQHSDLESWGEEMSHYDRLTLEQVKARRA